MNEKYSDPFLEKLGKLKPATLSPAAKNLIRAGLLKADISGPKQKYSPILPWLATACAALLIFFVWPFSEAERKSHSQNLTETKAPQIDFGFYKYMGLDQGRGLLRLERKGESISASLSAGDVYEAHELIALTQDYAVFKCKGGEDRIVLYNENRFHGNGYSVK